MVSDIDSERHHAATYRVRFDEAGPDGLLRTAGLLRYAQDLGWRHSEAVGFDRAWYAERGLAWVVRAAALEVLEPVPTGTELHCTTRVTAFERVWARRRAECHLPDGRLAGWVHTDWLILDSRGRISRVPPEIVERFPTPGAGEGMLRVRLADPPPDAARSSWPVRGYELDPMNHPNNAVYVDWLEEALRAAGGAAAAVTTTLPRRYRLEYAAAPAVGTSVAAACWPVADSWSLRLEDEAGGVLLRAVAEGPAGP